MKKTFIFLLLWLINPSYAQFAPTFEVFDSLDSVNFVRNSPSSTTGTELGLSNLYCFRVVERIRQLLLETPHKNEVVSEVICTDLTGNGASVVNPVSGELVFPMEVLQMQKCVYKRPLGHDDAKNVCGNFYDVTVIGRQLIDRRLP